MHICPPAYIFTFVSQEASRRCEKQFTSSLEDKDELLQQMLDWAFGGFNPMGPGGFKQATNGMNI